MKKTILFFTLMFSGGLFAQSGANAELEPILQITDEEFRAHIHQDLELVPPEELFDLCLELKLAAYSLSLVCELGKQTSTEMENKACFRSIELLNISVEECNKKLKKSGEQK